MTVALAAHIGAWQVRDDIETRAKRGNLETLDKILACIVTRNTRHLKPAEDIGIVLLTPAEFLAKLREQT